MRRQGPGPTGDKGNSEPWWDVQSERAQARVVLWILGHVAWILGCTSAPQPAAAPPEPPPPTQSHELDLGAQGPATLDVWYGAHGAVMQIEQNGSRWTSAIYELWHVEVGDLDHDGVDEIVLGMWSRTPRHDEPQPHRTLWVMAWNGRELQSLWRGSSLARPLLQATLQRQDATTTLLTLEQHRDTTCSTAVYAWHGFNFIVTRRSPSACDTDLGKDPL